MEKPIVHVKISIKIIMVWTLYNSVRVHLTDLVPYYLDKFQLTKECNTKSTWNSEIMFKTITTYTIPTLNNLFYNMLKIIPFKIILIL